MPHVHAFDHPHQPSPIACKDLLGGKGAGLAEMTSVLGLPVPPGFTITTQACREALHGEWPEGLADEVRAALADLEQRMGRRVGAADDPLLVSVRSGAKVSMPGMMDTVLDLGLNDRSVEGLAAVTDERFAYDSYRRFLSMYGRVVLGVDGHQFERLLDTARDWDGADGDADITPATLRRLCERYQDLVEKATGSPFPQDPIDQLRGAIDAVFRSWQSPRAVTYRNREGIPHDLGTAVNVQAMVFGNRDDQSGTGVAFTRDASTGADGLFGDFLVNAQGEDVVAGIRSTMTLDQMAELFPGPHQELVAIAQMLERHHRDMLDLEFTIESGKLWMLQSRIGKRTGAAALRMAVQMVDDEHIRLSRAEAVSRVSADHLDQVLHPQFAPADRDVIVTGLAASPGAAVGTVVFTADDAVAAHERGEDVILVRPETSPEDVHGMSVAAGILTSRGGLVSHAAVVARGWGKPAVCGAESVVVHDDYFTVGDLRVDRGEVISIDGTTGEVVRGGLALTTGQHPKEFETILDWADELREGGLGVRANADTPEDARHARDYGAEGIGLCRTEHMFLGDRLPVVQRMILASTPDEEAAALEDLRRVQKEDFLALLEVMDGLPVTVRLLDPPLHEFLPHHDELIVAEALGELDGEGLAMLEAAEHWREQNPMLGIRGVRLAVLKDGLYRMQVRALMQAAVDRVRAGGRPVVEVMIPLVVSRPELELARSWVEQEVADVVGEAALDDDGRRRLAVAVGTMVETPRAAICAADIAGAADFFSFGTNDLTQMTFGFSRDDVEGRLVPPYVEQGLLVGDPFESIDVEGVGSLVRNAVAAARGAKPHLKVGVCGEHGGDPASIRFFADAGLDYVSCSPFRVPIARLAAAHAAMASGDDDASR